MEKKLCPCHSGKPYAECCQPYHEGKLPENALLLMRSRYAAYALGLTPYIIQTTHPDNPRYQQNKKKWTEEIEHFYGQTHFRDLKILSFVPGDEEAFVTFTAYLQKGSEDLSFTEKSRFLKVHGQWLYRDGLMN